MTTTQNQQQAFVDLVDRYLERVYRYLRNLTRSEDAARDAAHEAFVKLRETVERGARPTEAYVFATARNTALTHWRLARSEDRKRRELALARDGAVGVWCGAGVAASPGLAVERRDLRDALEAALAELPEDQRSVFLLSAVEGLKYEQIAEVLDVPSGTVASRKHLAVRALRAELERTGHALR